MKDDKRIVEIINRITGKNFDINSSIKLSSAQQYALITLCKKNGKKIYKNLINSTFTIKNLLDNAKHIDIKQTQNIKKKINDIKKTIRAKNNFAVGIDIQNIAEFSKLIDEKNLKKSHFIKDYFTDREITYSESKPDVLETICGIYSAKECIRKAGNKDNFKDIEIMHKEDGRPFFKDCYISISHSAGMCIAICIQTQI